MLEHRKDKYFEKLRGKSLSYNVLKKIKNQYKLCFTYIAHTIAPIFPILMTACIIVYFASAIAIEYFGVKDPRLTIMAWINRLMNNTMKIVGKNAGAALAVYNGKQQWWEYFLNNTKANGASLVSGLLPIYFYSVIVALSNAISLAMATVPLVNATGKSLIFVVFCSILPHGIVEIPISTMCDAAGTQTCFLMTGIIFLPKKRKELWKRFKWCTKEELRMYVLIVIPAMLISSIIETYVTPFFMKALA